VRNAIRSYKASESSARDLISTIWNVMGDDVENTATIVNQLVDLLDDEDKKKDLLAAWNGFKIEVCNLADAIRANSSSSTVAQERLPRSCTYVSRIWLCWCCIRTRLECQKRDQPPHSRCTSGPDLGSCRTGGRLLKPTSRSGCFSSPNTAARALPYLESSRTFAGSAGAWTASRNTENRMVCI
jgi:hypothetical protein